MSHLHVTEYQIEVALRSVVNYLLKMSHAKSASKGFWLCEELYPKLSIVDR